MVLVVSIACQLLRTDETRQKISLMADQDIPAALVEAFGPKLRDQQDVLNERK
jgi:hypothetical protein